MLGQLRRSDKRAAADLGRHLQEAGQSVVEELAIAFAEVALAAEIVLIESGAVLQTPAPANRQVSTDEALVGEVLLQAGKGLLVGAGGELLNGRLAEIAQPPFRLDEEIAAEGVAGVLDDDILTALLVERADCVSAGEVIRQDGIEVADAHVSRPVLVPAVEQPAEEFAVLFRRDGKIRYLARRWLDLDARNKLQEPDAQPHEKIEYLVWVRHVPGVYQRERVEFDLVLFAALDGAHDPVECP